MVHFHYVSKHKDQLRLLAVFTPRSWKPGGECYFCVCNQNTDSIFALNSLIWFLSQTWVVVLAYLEYFKWFFFLYLVFQSNQALESFLTNLFLWELFPRKYFSGNISKVFTILGGIFQGIRVVYFSPLKYTWNYFIYWVSWEKKEDSTDFITPLFLPHFF